jgi:hypothetical protein
MSVADGVLTVCAKQGRVSIVNDFLLQDLNQHIFIPELIVIALHNLQEPVATSQAVPLFASTWKLWTSARLLLKKTFSRSWM